MKGQAAILDAMFFMLMCSAAATLLFVTAGNYATTVNSQVGAIYNYEWMRTAAIALYYSKDDAGNWTLVELRDRLAKLNAKSLVGEYFRIGSGSGVWNKFAGSAPSANATLLFRKGATSIWLPAEIPFVNPYKTVYAYETVLPDKNGNPWEVIVYLPYG